MLIKVLRDRPKFSARNCLSFVSQSRLPNGERPLVRIRWVADTRMWWLRVDIYNLVHVYNLVHSYDYKHGGFRMTVLLWQCSYGRQALAKG